jgi:hypothetical protein
MIALVAVLMLAQKQCRVCHTFYVSKGEVLTEQRFESITRKALGMSFDRSTFRGMLSIANRESGRFTREQNKRSSAFGLYQFLNSTWKDTGIKKTDCPVCQTLAMLKYVQKRYGSVQAALHYHKIHGYY